MTLIKRAEAGSAVAVFHVDAGPSPVSTIISQLMCAHRCLGTCVWVHVGMCVSECVGACVCEYLGHNTINYIPR